MRMRRLKWAPEFLENSPIVMHEPEMYRGKWKEYLNREILHVEIGTGKGDYWIQMSDMYEEIGWIGIEKNESVAAMAVRKSGEKKENRCFIQADAADIEQWFEKGEVDVIHLNFSDPWPKKKASKRRLSHSSFLEKYEEILSENGEIQMKTDNAKLFEFSLLQFAQTNFTLVDFSVDFRREEHLEDAITEYESKFMEKGNPIYRAVWKKGK